MTLTDTPSTEIHGTVADGFEAVRDEFAATAETEPADFSAQLAAYHHGELVVDLWTGPGVLADSLMCVYSATKGAAHLVAALVVQDGDLDLDTRVSHYWPEFAVHGKQDLLVRELFAHRAGLAGADAGFSVDELADDRLVAERLGAQRPYWRPGAAFGYHALVMGALTNEVVRRASGRTIQELFAERVREAHGVDFYIGLPSDQESRFLSAQPPLITPERQAFFTETATGSNSLNGIAFDRNHPEGPAVWELPNFPVVRTQGPASFGGIASARGLARMYAAAIDPLDGRDPLLTPATAAAFAQVQSTGYDLVLREQKSFTVGFHPSFEVYPVLGQGAFGHSGAGGQQAFADPRSGLAYGYSRRRTPFPAVPAPENDRLIPILHAAALARTKS